jgi:hypothetical protein
MMIKITWGSCKNQVSQAPPVRLLKPPIQLGSPATLGDSYHLRNTLWKHLAHSSFASVTFCALYVGLLSQEK